jgi:hypothetical protein
MFLRVLLWIKWHLCAAFVRWNLSDTFVQVTNFPVTCTFLRTAAITYSHHIQSSRTAITYSHHVQSSHTAITYSHYIQSSNTVITYIHHIVITYSHYMQSSHTAITYSHHIQSLHTVITYSHLHFSICGHFNNNSNNNNNNNNNWHSVSLNVYGNFLSHPLLIPPPSVYRSLFSTVSFQFSWPYIAL